MPARFTSKIHDAGRLPLRKSAADLCRPGAPDPRLAGFVGLVGNNRANANAAQRAMPGSAEPVEAARRAGEQRPLFRRRTARGDALERVPEHRVAAAAL